MVRILASIAVAAGDAAKASSRPQLGFAARPVSALRRVAAQRHRGRCLDLGVAAVRAQQSGAGMHDHVVPARG